ncbi:endonuclease/exonuclease/phosphatase family protein [Ruegeria sp. R14_0]|uniref:endonuclease/exonuclease/phosphatase family protein n=1 Tax=Ruegeria sp. R14_0 TaxID=2821100 RepID=UPI001AD9F24C|nr:endonuclease/exonuclease/phosphatase family protein [Ruegeria sp. R14_0]MBO9447416.1 endonuclease [Ruegeria sp. R14_0]
MNTSTIRCATWNIHRAKGSDGQFDPARVVGAIEAELVPLRLDVLALQEADEECRPHARIVDVQKIAELTGLTYTQEAPTIRWSSQSDGFLGSILFLSDRFKRTHADVIDLPGHCHRGALALETLVDGFPLRIVTMHLSLSQPLRVIQMRIIGQYLHRRPTMQTLMLGDFNEWRPWGGLMFHRRIVGTAFKGPARASFPSRAPFVPLDRILTDLPGTVSEVQALRSEVLMRASDHLPVTGVVRLGKSD